MENLLLKVDVEQIQLNRNHIGLVRTCVISNLMMPPYIVTGLNKRAISVKSRKGNVSSAIRSDFTSINETLREIVSTVKEQGIAYSWGNQFELGQNGLRKAVEYVLSSGEWVGGIEMLNRDGNNYGSKIPTKIVTWIPDDVLAVIITKDKSYFGDIFVYGNNEMYSVLVHNPSRPISLVMK